MHDDFLSLYEDISVAGLTADLHERMQTIRPGVSRNTIRLAFVEGATTPLRKRIIQEGRALLEQHQNQQAAAEPIAA